MKKLLSMLGIGLLMASCTDGYTNWANPITSSPEEPLAIGITVSPAAAIDFATVTTEKVQLFSAAYTAPDEAILVGYSAEITSEDGSKSIAVEVDNNGFADTDELESAITTLYGRRPVARTIPVNVVGQIELNKMVVDANGDYSPTVEIQIDLVKGDANGDGDVDKDDIAAVVNYIMTGNRDGFYYNNADLNGDTIVNAADLVLLINQLK